MDLPMARSSRAALEHVMRTLTPKRMRPLLSRAYYAMLDAGDAVAGRRDPLTPPRSLRRISTDPDNDYRATGREFVAFLARECDVGADAAILDVGCGVGRVAVGLTEYLSEAAPLRRVRHRPGRDRVVPAADHDTFSSVPLSGRRRSQRRLQPGRRHAGVAVSVSIPGLFVRCRHRGVSVHAPVDAGSRQLPSGGGAGARARRPHGRVVLPAESHHAQPHRRGSQCIPVHEADRGCDGGRRGATVMGSRAR